MHKAVVPHRQTRKTNGTTLASMRCSKTTSCSSSSKITNRTIGRRANKLTSTSRKVVSKAKANSSHKDMEAVPMLRKVLYNSNNNRTLATVSLTNRILGTRTAGEMLTSMWVATSFHNIKNTSKLHRLPRRINRDNSLRHRPVANT